MNILQRYNLLSTSILMCCFFFSAGVFSSGVNSSEVNNADVNSTGSMANIDTSKLGDIKQLNLIIHK
jgi:hypothetical protein